MKTLIAAATLAILGVSSASAAEMAARTYTKAPPMVAPAVYSWNGFYIGGQVGGSWARTDLTSDLPGATIGYRVRRDSVDGGAFLGYQHQWNWFVLGIEGSYITGGDRANFLPIASSSIFFPGGTSLSASVKTKNVWSVGGRVGAALDNWLPYATAGYASGTYEFNQAQAGSTQFGRTDLEGYYVGAGLDWAPWRNGVVLGVEYRHYDFDSKAATVFRTPGAFVEPVRFNPKIDTVMARVSYKFGPLFGAW